AGASGGIDLGGGTVDNAGAFTLHDGVLLGSSAPASFHNLVGGVLAASSAIGPMTIGSTVVVDNAGGTIAVDEGTLTFDGGYTQASGTTSLQGGALASPAGTT